MEKYSTKVIEASISSFFNGDKGLSSQDVIERLKNSINKIRNFPLVILSYVLSSILFFISVAIIIYFINKSLRLSCTLFIIAIPAIIGISLFGIGKAVSNLVIGINDTLDYMFELAIMYYKDQQKNPSREVPSVFHAIQILFSYFLIPIIKNVISGKLFGKLVILFMSKAVKKISNNIQKDSESTITEEEKTFNPSYNFEQTQSNLQIIEKIRITTTERSSKYLRRFKIFINTMSILCIIIGIPIMILLIFISELARIIH